MDGIYTPGFYIRRTKRFADKADRIIQEGLLKSTEHEYVPSYLESIVSEEEGDNIRDLLTKANTFAKDKFIHSYKEADLFGTISLRLAWLSKDKTEKEKFAKRAIEFYQKALQSYKEEEKFYPDYFWTNLNLGAAYKVVGDSKNDKKYGEIAQKIIPKKE